MNRTSARSALACTSLCLLLAAALHAPAAVAAERTIHVSATGVCDAPLPVFNAELRRRPVALQNESTRSVFVTCTLPADWYGRSDNATVRVAFRAFAAAASISCTMVSGTNSIPYYVSEEQAIEAGGQATVAWEEIDKWSNSGTYSFSCNLPVGVAMETISHTQFGDQGRI